MGEDTRNGKREWFMCKDVNKYVDISSIAKRVETYRGVLRHNETL